MPLSGADRKHRASLTMSICCWPCLLVFPPPPPPTLCYRVFLMAPVSGREGGNQSQAKKPFVKPEAEEKSSGDASTR